MTSEVEAWDASRPLRAATLVVPTLDRPDLLAGLLRSVLEGDALPDEILVMDQSATCDGRVEALAHAAPIPLRHVHRSTAGTSLARNDGAHLAANDLILYLDDDVVVDRAWCRSIRARFAADDRPAVVTGRVVSAPSTSGGSFAPSTIDATEPAIHTDLREVDVLYTNNVGIDRRVLFAHGGFDVRLGPGTRFPAAEDNDLAHRLLVAGVAIVYDPSAVVAHVAWRPLAARRRLRWRYGVGQGAFLAKHVRAGGSGTASRFRSDVRRYLGRAVRRAWHDRSGAVDDLAYVAGLLRGAVGWWLGR